jgi:hypothetical protein
MNLNITTQNREEYLYIECKGEITSADELIEQSNLVYEEFLKYNPEKILLYEMEMDFPPGLSAYLNLVNHYMDNFVPEVRSIRVAVVIQDKYKDIGDFWETVCLNRGFQYQTFTDLSKAESWILKK